VTVQLLHGDCRALLAGLPAGAFDACIADPPYGDTSLGWDSIVDGWIPAVARVLKPAASMWVFGSMRFLATRQLIDRLEGWAR
jgi:site-specific DNA-methyltransferase (adenine-specific)